MSSCNGAKKARRRCFGFNKIILPIWFIWLAKSRDENDDHRVVFFSIAHIILRFYIQVQLKKNKAAAAGGCWGYMSLSCALYPPQ